MKPYLTIIRIELILFDGVINLELILIKWNVNIINLNKTDLMMWLIRNVLALNSNQDN